MPNEFPMMDPKDIWQGQRTESFAISTEELRRRAHRLQTRARLEALSRIIIGLILFVLFARTFARVDELFQRLGWGVLSVWALYGAYQAYKWIWPSKLKPDADDKRFTGVLQIRAREEARLRPPYLAPGGSGLVFLRPDDRSTPCNPRIDPSPASSVERRSVSLPSGHLVHSVLLDEKAKKRKLKKRLTN